MKVSQRAQQVPPSATIAVTARAQQLKAQGVDIVGFGAGAPDFDTPNYIKDAAVEALKAGKTKYTAAAGIPALRAAIAEKFRKENGLDYTPDQIIVTIGGKHAVYEAMQAVLDPGDEVILPAPYWVTYPEAVKLAGATARIIHTDKTTSYKITPAQLADALTEQAERRARGEKVLMGQILLERGLLDEEGVKKVLDTLYPVHDEEFAE